MAKKLYFRYSSMNAGKTTQLLQVAHNYSERGMKAIILKPEIDTKGNDYVVSRLGVEKKVDILIGKYDDIFEIIKGFIQATHVDAILVDEVQMLTKEQVDQLFKIAVKLNIATICYGLRTDFAMNSFCGSERLLCLAHSIEELKTICSCGKKATLNLRKVNGVPVFEGEQVLIDNDDKIEYISVCPECYFKLKEMYK